MILNGCPLCALLSTDEKDREALLAHIAFEQKLEAARQEAARNIIRAMEAEILGDPCKDAEEGQEK